MMPSALEGRCRAKCRTMRSKRSTGEACFPAHTEYSSRYYMPSLRDLRCPLYVDRCVNDSPLGELGAAKRRIINCELSGFNDGSKARPKRCSQCHIDEG